MWAAPLRNIRACCMEQVLTPVEYNEVPSDLSPDNWQSSGEVCAATAAGFHLLARYQGRLIPTSLYSVEILPPLK